MPAVDSTSMRSRPAMLVNSATSAGQKPSASNGRSPTAITRRRKGRAGAVAINRAAARNGTFAGTEELPERFTWRFGEEIVLGEKWTSAPVVRIALQPVERRT